MSEKLLTIFTPTYNRADLLERCYDYLKRQTSFNFKWLIVDDGSTDETKVIVNDWIENEKLFEIEYIYKENGGLHTAYNTAIENMNTELCMCIDSDDYPSENAVELIEKYWNSRNKEVEYAGLIGLDYKTNGELVGGRLKNYSDINLVDWTMGKYPVKKGDKKLVVRVDLYKSVFPMKKYPGEKNYNPNYMNIKIGFDKNYIVLDECLCYVDYQEDGMTNSMLWQYYNSPNSFRDIRLLYLSFPNSPLKFKIKHTIHYISSSILSKQKIFSGIQNKIITFFCLPFGFLLSKYIKYNNRV